jgi:hypothetical protein
MLGSTHRFTVGDFLCVNFCDADQLRQSEGLFPQIPPDTLKQEFATSGYQWDALKFSITILYIRTPEHSILVDTGLGGNMSNLTESLLLAGIELNRIDTVIITHGHPDHIGGIIGSNGCAHFPESPLCILEIRMGTLARCGSKSRRSSQSRPQKHPADTGQSDAHRKRR